MRPIVLTTALALVLSCAPPPVAPPTREVVHVSGGAYQRGLEHGQKMRSKIRSFYTTLLTASLFPFLGREQPDLAVLLKEYNKERYQNGRFAYELLLDSARSLGKSIPRVLEDELRGISDGSGLSYDEILLLNTFVDSVMAVRGIAYDIRLSRSPALRSLSIAGLTGDSVDNDGDGDTDESDEGSFAPFAPVPNALAVELPLNPTFTFNLFDLDGVDPASVRIQLVAGAQSRIYTSADPELVVALIPGGEATVTFKPAPLPAATVVTLVLAAGDQKVVSRPAPDHVSFMRDEELLFTTVGAGKKPWAVRRPVLDDGRSRPPSWAVALSGQATANARAFLAQEFALLDANTSHKHTQILVHHPTSGPAFATVGWAGIAWGFAGLNTEGVGYACNPSDTLDNSVVGSMLEKVADLSTAQLLARGLPIGMVGRRILETAKSADDAADVFRVYKHPYGWSCVVGDSKGALHGIEVESGAFGGDTVFQYEADTKDANGQFLASARGSEVLTASVYSANVADAPLFEVAGQKIVPQRYWSSYYYKSRRTLDRLAERIDARYGAWDVEKLQGLLSEPELIDRSDSMNAVVLDLAGRTVHTAMGAVPATSAPFESLLVKQEAP